jgi:protein involved in polysaccharide export with SLBB domain
MSSLLTTIREFLGPPDPRSEREIEDDIDAEFAFHIEQIERELIEQGVPPEHAAHLARARFGNQMKLKLRCKRIALEERIMLQRINPGLMIVVLLAITGLGVQMLVTQKSSRQTLELITTELTALRTVISDRETAAVVSPGEIPAVESRLVYLEGDVQRAGTYNLPIGTELTVRRLLAGAGGADDGASIELVRRESWGPVRKQLGTLSELKAEPDRDIILQPGDLVTVRQFQHTPEGTAPTHAEDAESRILIEGDIERPGWYPISLDEATLIYEMLKRVNVNERQWVRHRRAGETHTQYELAELFLDEDPQRTVIRPGDEIHIADHVPDVARRTFAARNADRFLFAYKWKQIDEHGEPVDGGWHFRFVPSEYGPRPFSAISLFNPVREVAYTIQIGGPTSYLLIVPDGQGQRRQVSVRWSFDVETITLTITRQTERGNVYWSEEEHQAILEQAGLSRELTFARFPLE